MKNAAINANNFDEAWVEVIRFEGGYVNDPLDAGGETKYGISKRQYPHLNIEALSESDAQRIYLTDYWLKYRLNEVVHAQISTKLMSLLINLPPKWWGLIVQRALRAVKTPVVEDGVVGSKTLAAINKADPDLYLVALRSEAAGYYRGLKNKRFENGWLNRAYS